MIKFSKLALLSASVMCGVGLALADGPGLYSDTASSDSASQKTEANGSDSSNSDGNATGKKSVAFEVASGERLATAVGHYSRARALLIEAVRSFEMGRSVAKPDSLINSDQWKKDLIARAEDLEIILNPQPRATKTGVKFGADTRLLNTTKR